MMVDAALDVGVVAYDASLAAGDGDVALRLVGLG